MSIQEQAEGLHTDISEFFRQAGELVVQTVVPGRSDMFYYIRGVGPDGALSLASPDWQDRRARHLLAMHPSPDQFVVGALLGVTRRKIIRIGGGQYIDLQPEDEATAKMLRRLLNKTTPLSSSTQEIQTALRAITQYAR